jgi:RimJ/RimL family protein N-acetyltransferase
MDIPDRMEGDRVRLVLPRVEHADALFERVTSDPEVPYFMSWATHPDVGETRRVITEVFNVATETGTEHARLIELRDSGDIAGVCGWRRLSEHTVEFGYFLPVRCGAGT